MKKSDVTVIFQPGCFDSFEGTQQELDELTAEITRLAQSGELVENATEIDQDMLDDLDEQDREQLMSQIVNFLTQQRDLRH
jgi:hypothetical protein